MDLRQIILESVDWVCWFRDRENWCTFSKMVFKFSVSEKAGIFH